MSTLAAVVLCAGKGTRMKSDTAFGKAKVLHEVLGRPLCAYPIARAFAVGASPVVAVVGHQAEQVQATVSQLFEGQPLRFAVQAEQKGTGHAVQCAGDALRGYSGPVLILYGDVPLLREETLQALVQAYRESGGPLALVTTLLDNPTGYGRVVREQGHVKRIVEHKDATPEERAIKECNAGIYVVDSAFLFDALGRLTPQNAQGELYLTDLVEQAAKVAGAKIKVVVADHAETAGVNDRAELAARAKELQARINARHMRNGVTLRDPSTTFIEETVELAPDVEVGPFVSLHGRTRIGSGVRIGQGCVITDSVILEGTDVKPYSILEDAEVGTGCAIGPFARLRPGTKLAEGVHLGNFVETKKARIGKGSKANHLSYLGDAEIGAGVNVGAGTITCNYDGVNKHQTTLEDGVFIGSDTQLVAPVTVGKGAYVGAGTTVTEDVPPMSLTLSRAPQVIKEGWVEKKAKKRAGT
ncbi:MAG: bifunctional UDP-N-acetylglucosamine diphosphorylase/glucosamine-1-phosphate N-acetyltransferase GlmU [Myxococcaceae bacterium]|nr:bifunctional UDP-N-acetylglucosamine diphosphorylase/glucosamine-1-phosphate N-acetyltransferase GlmU [Myxococcaceae bacterium]